MSNLITNSRVQQVYQWCSEIYSSNGHILRFPKNTNPCDTYQWRYLRSLASKFDELDLSDEDCRKFIEIIIKYAKNNGLTSKGLAIFQQSNIIDVCYDSLVKMQNNSECTLSSLSSMKTWLDSKISDNDPVRVLTDRKNINGLCNITTWYESSKISDLFFALSRCCGRAYSRLNEMNSADCDFLPNQSKCYIIRAKVTQDSNFVQRAKQIFGNDWRNVCQR